MAEGVLVDKLYYQLGWEVNKANADASSFEQSGEVISQAAENAAEAIGVLLEEIAKTPEGMAELQRMAEDLLGTTDRVSEGMTRAASGSEKFETGMRRLAQQEAEARVQAERLNRPVDEVSGGMSRAASGTAKYEQGLRRLAQQQVDARTQSEHLARANERLLTGMSQSGRVAEIATAGNRAWEAGLQRLKAQQEATNAATTRAADGASKGAGKIQNALVSLAIQGTGTSGAIGKVVEGALLLGAGSLAVTGAAAGITLLTTLYRAISREAREASEAAKQLAKDTGESLLQSATARASAAINEAQEVVERLQAVRKEKGFADGRPVSLADRKAKADSDRELTVAEGNLKTRELALEKARTEQRRQFDAVLYEVAEARNRLELAISNNRSVGLPTLELEQELADLKKLQQAVASVPPAERAGVRAAIESQQAEARARAATRLEAIRTSLTKQFTENVPETVEATSLALARLQTELLQTGATADQVDKAVAPLVARLRELSDAALGERIAGIEAGPDTAASLVALDQLFTELGQKQALLTAGSADDLAIRKQIADVIAATARLNARIAGQVEQTEADTEGVYTNLLASRSTLSQIVSEIGDISRGAIGIAQAFGVADDKTAAMLQNVVSVASTLPRLLDQVDKIGKLGADGKQLFNPATFTTSLVGVLGGVAGIVSGFLQENPADRRANEIRERNSDVIAKLTDEIGNLNLDISGKAFSEGVKGIAELLAADSKRIGKNGDGSFYDNLVDRGRDINKRAIDSILRGTGSSLRELKDLAASLNIELNTDNVQSFRDSLKQLQKALRETELTQFAQSFAGAMQALQDELELFDITDPLEQLKAFQEFTQRRNGKGELVGSQAIADALKGLNLDDPNQRAEAERRLQELFLKLKTGELTPEALGLTLDEFRRLLLEIEGLIDKTNAEDGSGTGGDPVQETFGATRGVTEVTGNRLAGLLESQDLHLVEIRDLLARGFGFGGFVAPPVIPTPGTVTTGGGGIVIHIAIQNSFAAGTTVAQAQALGVANARSLAPELDRELGSILRQKRLTSGQTRSR